MVSYYCFIYDGVSSRRFVVESASAYMAAVKYAKNEADKSVTVCRKRTLEIISRVEKHFGDWCNTWHPIYLENFMEV